MGIQNNLRVKMVAKNHQIQSSFQNFEFSSSNCNKRIPNSVGSNISSSRIKYKDKQKKER
jgi:hypothetical protein